MTQVFALNGVTYAYIEEAKWLENDQGKALDGEAVHNRWRGHSWLTQIMPISEFDVLYALEGQKVVITTTDYEDRNGDYKVYYVADLRQVFSRHVSQNMQQLQCEFLIRL